MGSMSEVRIESENGKCCIEKSCDDVIGTYLYSINEFNTTKKIKNKQHNIT